MLIRGASPLAPGRRAPPLSIALASGGRWILAERRPERFTLIAMFRGAHCGQCKRYIQTLDSLAEDFNRLGVEAIAVSRDDREQAIAMVGDWDLHNLSIGYGFDLAEAAIWNLYISAGRKAGEPDYFSEPGLFLVATDGTLFFASIANMPFARPPLAELLDWIPRIAENAIPARGEQMAWPPTETDVANMNAHP